MAQGDAGAALTAGTAAAADDTLVPHPIEGMYEHAGDGALTGVPAGVSGSGNVPMPTGDDNMYHQYRVTITPHQKSADFTIKIRVKEFHDGGSPIRNTYVAPGFGESGNLPNGRDILSIDVKGAARNLQAGYRVSLKKDIVIPAGGYLVIAKNKAGSAVTDSGDRINDSPRATHRTPAQMLYNIIDEGNLNDPLPNLATQFLNGVVVDVESQHAGIVITEVMWGEDVSLNPSTNSQYIELYNPGGQYKTVDDADHTPNINEALTLIFYAPNEFADVPAKTAVAATATTPASMALPAGVTDRIGTLDAKGAYWSPTSKGQSGSSGVPLGADTDLEITIARTAVTPIVSMYRGMVPDTSVGAAVGAMMPADGQMATSWMSSAGPKSANFQVQAIGVRHGTPGAATDATDTPADTAAEAKAKADAAAAAAKKTASTGNDPTERFRLHQRDYGRWWWHIATVD